MRRGERVDTAACMALHAECEAWSRQTGASLGRLSLAAGLSHSYVSQLRGRLRFSEDAANALRDTMRRYPTGALPEVVKGVVRSVPVATPQEPVMSAEEASARERAQARRLSPEYVARLRSGSAAERAATLCVETPAELIATVKRQWPGQWERIVAEARAAGMMPGAMLARVIERGLEAGA